MNRQSICFTPGTVICELESTEKYAAIHELIEKAPVFRNLRDPEAFEKTVLHREEMQSTGYGKGVAFAHGRISGTQDLFIALGISRKGIQFDSIDGKPVHLLFIIANNPSKRIEYLAALSTLAEIVRDNRFRTRLINSACSKRLEKKLNTAFLTSLAKKSA